jgi:hypothetical protein
MLIPFSTVVQYIRDGLLIASLGGFIYGVIKFGWKADAHWQDLVALVQPIETFMGNTEQRMEALLTNHVKHIEEDMAAIRAALEKNQVKRVEAPKKGLEQNPQTKSRWAQLARSGKKVMQFLSEGRYVANVVDGKVMFY